MLAKDQNPAFRTVPQDAPGRLHAIEVGHSDIHDHHIGFMLPGLSNRLQAISRYPHHFDV